MRLVVEVTPEALQVRLAVGRPPIPLNEIARPKRASIGRCAEFGGWGVRGLSPRSRAYNVSGDQGVQLTLRDGDIVLIGSQAARSPGAGHKTPARLKTRRRIPYAAFPFLRFS